MRANVNAVLVDVDQGDGPPIAVWVVDGRATGTWRGTSTDPAVLRAAEAAVRKWRGVPRAAVEALLAECDEAGDFPVGAAPVLARQVARKLRAMLGEEASHA
jgi:hypothetical protein